MNAFEMANPVEVTKRVAGLAGTAVGVTGTVAREAVHVPVGVAKGAIQVAGAAAGLAGTVVRETAHAFRTGADADAVVQAEPHVADEPPVDVVGEALAREAAAERGDGPPGAGMAHEPRGASRDEEHGDAALQRAEVEELAEEAAAALEGDVEPEEHLKRPLLDPADVKAAAADLTTMSRAADPDKG
jgi:hypothetical protein